jgi:hypothetical protein
MGYKVGNRVRFTDKSGRKVVSYITRIVPKGEYSSKEEAYAIGGASLIEDTQTIEYIYGSYVRTAEEIELA